MPAECESAWMTIQHTCEYTYHVAARTWLQTACMIARSSPIHGALRSLKGKRDGRAIYASATRTATRSGQKSIHSGKNCFLVATYPMEDFAAHACTHAHVHLYICMAASEQSALLSHDLGLRCPLSFGARFLSLISDDFIPCRTCWRTSWVNSSQTPRDPNPSKRHREVNFVPSFSDGSSMDTLCGAYIWCFTSP